MEAKGIPEVPRACSLRGEAVLFPVAFRGGRSPAARRSGGKCIVTESRRYGGT